MFNAEISDVYITVLSEELTPWTSKVQLVPEGTGNEGVNLEYQCSYDGHCMKYSRFKELMDEVEF